MKTRTRTTKLLSLLLAAIMVLSLLPVTAHAAKVDSGCTPGTYTGTAQGFKGEVNVTVTLEEKDGNVVISGIEATGESETPAYWASAVAVLDTIKENNGTDGVDAVSGATKSSTGIINATNEALSKAVAGFAGGTGTQSDPYLISSEAGLRYLQQQVAGGTNYAGQYIKLSSDIALTGEWIPIGSSSSLAFAGNFDGAGHTVSGMTISDSTLSYAGLFGYTLNGVTIKNIKLTGVNINMTEAAQNVYAASLVGFIKVDTKGTASSVIDNCTASGSIIVKNADKITVVGGLTAFTDQRAAITNCGTNVDINADSGAGRATVGGLSAWVSIQSLLMNDYVLGNVTAATEHDSYGNVGGVFGQVNGVVYNVYNAGNVTLNTSKTIYNAGEIAGDLAAATYADSCYYSGNGNAFDRASGKYNSESVASRAEEIGTQALADVLHANLAPAVLTAVSAKVTAAKVTGISSLEQLTSRVGGKFYDWIVSGSAVVHSSAIWTSGDIDASVFASGDGSEENPYIISTADQLKAFAGSMNEKIDYTGKYVALGADIAVTGDWTPIGGSDYLFNGTFDGKGCSITGLSLGTKEAPYALDKENLYIGLFGLLGANAVVKNVRADVAFYTSYEATAFVGGIAGYTDGSSVSGDYTGAVIDGCYVSGTISHAGAKGNQNVGGIIGMQYKGALINSASTVSVSNVVSSGDLAEAGGLAGLNNRGLVANCWADCTVYGSGSRENGNEGMAVVSSLVACNAGALVNCYASGDVSTYEHSTYAGMVSGWVTGIGKSYSCWYDLGSTMTLKTGDANPQKVSPVESIGTKVASGVNDEGDAYTGGLVDKMTGVNGADASLAEALNASFAAFPIDITVYGLDNASLRTWTFDNSLGFGSEAASVTYVQPECEKVVKPELTLLDGTWYGRDDDKLSVVSIEVKDGRIVKTVISGESEGEAYKAALEKAKYKATYGDFSDYAAADPGKFAGGSGTAEDPYLIANEAQLRYLSGSVNADVSWSGVYFRQTADITLSGQWQPIGWALNGEVGGKKSQICAYPFRGNYDGGGYSISGLTIGSADAPADMMTAGLFGLTSGEYITNDVPTGSEQTVTIKNVNLKNVYINVQTRYETFIGGLVGSGQYGIYIDNCTVTGEIASATSESFSRAGGIGGSVMRGSVTNSGADVKITAATDTNNVYAGGFYGMDNRVTTVNCYALGSVTGNSTNNNKVHIGGFVGQAGGIHINCYAAGDVVSLKTTTDVGIISGRSGGIAVDRSCYYNTDAYLKQGDTVVSPAAAVGVNANNQAVVSNVAGKTASELKSADFAKLLTANTGKEEMEASAQVVAEALAAQAERGFDQQNYYTGNELLGWTADGSGYAVLSSSAEPDPVKPTHSHSIVADAAIAPTCTETGLTEGSHCSTCNAVITAQETVPALGHSFSDGVCTVCGAKDPAYNPFADVKEDSFYGDAVIWAAANGITKGTTATTFSPDDGCTRAQIVTFLYRAAGSPKPENVKNPFTDVSESSVYYDAVMWAVSEGITKGTTAATFSPDKVCTRAEIIAFLYRASGDAQTGTAARFTDVAAGAWCAEAVAWAAANGVTKGTTDTTFSPNAGCTRAQAVTLIYRAQ